MKTAKVLWIATLLGLVATGAARAQDDYPNKPIRLVVPVPAGSTLDVRMRHFTQTVSQHLGWTLVIDNKPGAGQSIGMAFAAKAPPDGYTLLIVGNNLALNTYLQSNPGYDPIKSFAPITNTIQAPLVLVVNPDTGIKSVKDLVALANSKPGGLVYAHSGLGSTPYITAELLKQVTGIKALEVPFKGDSEWLPQLMAGRVDFGFSGPLTAAPMAQAGKVRAVAVTTRQRAHSLPDVPSISETYPSYDYPTFVGIVAPAATPKAIIDKLYAGFRSVVQLPDFQAKMRATGAEPIGSSPEEFAALLRADQKLAGDLVKALGLKPE